jgi:hypothetical protein
MRIIIFCILSITLLTSCFDIQLGEPIQGIAPGTWRAVFILDDQSVPIVLEISNNKDKSLDLVFKTGKQELKADAVRLWGDTLFADFKKTNTQLKVIYQVDQMDGFLYDNTGSEYPVRFTAKNAIMHRFPNAKKTPTSNLTGDWKISANSTQDSILTGSVRFMAKDNYLEATLLLEGKKSILLEGTVQGSKLYLSGFDGKTACILSATIKNSKSLVQGSLKLNNSSFFWEASVVAGVQN